MAHIVINSVPLLKLRLYQNHLEGSLSHTVLGGSSRFSDPVALEWGQRICISNTFLCDANTVGLVATL